MKTLWLIVAVTLGMVAVVLMWLGYFDAAFVCAALGVLAWFLNYRAQAKAAIAAIDVEEERSTKSNETALESFGTGVKDSDDVE